MKFNTMQEALRFREIAPLNTYWTMEYLDAAIEVFTRDIQKTFNFIKNDCTDEDFFWLNEIFEDIAEKAPLDEFIALLRNRLKQVTPDTYDQSSFLSKYMRENIDYDTYIEDVKGEIDRTENLIL